MASGPSPPQSSNVPLDARTVDRDLAAFDAMYAPLLRLASSLFQPEELDRLSPRFRGGPRLAQLNGDGAAALDPLAVTEAIAYDFLGKGGKYSRPFIALSVYDALTGGRMTGPNGERHTAEVPDAVRRTAMSIETFHKASLVHDDIEDDDLYRYGERTLHRQFGTATAINVGDYLIGMGYRLVSREAKVLGADVASDILDCLAEAHIRLTEGQGAELSWRDARDKSLTPADALRIYALKTAPAFEAALYCGARLAGDAAPYIQPMRRFARNVGIAFQILNDLADWQPDRSNKLAAGGDILGGRPTLLWALAIENVAPLERAELAAMIADNRRPAAERIAAVRRLYQRTNVFAQAERMVHLHRARAISIAEGTEPAPLRRLLHYLIAALVDRPLAKYAAAAGGNAAD